MPTMVRADTKARQIAYKILGVPQTVASKRSKKQKFVNERLWFEETQRVR